MAPPRPKASNPKSGDGHGAKDETPKKIRLGDTRDTLKKHHKSHEEKSQLKHSLTEKSIASLSCEHDVDIKANRLGDVGSPSMSLCCQDDECHGKYPTT